MNTATKAQMKSEHVEFEANASYTVGDGKTTILVDSVFREEGSEITDILSRLVKSEIENN